MSEIQALSAILQKLDVLTRLMAIQVVMSIKSRERQVEILHNAGFTSREIAELLDVKYATVGVTLFNIRKSKAKKKARQARQSRKPRK